MSKSVLVAIANGTEELEAVTIIDLLRRAGADVTIASVGELEITASRGVKIVGDAVISECSRAVYDLIVLPGGMPGAVNLRDSKELEQMLRLQHDEGRLYAAICAAPVMVLQHHGLLGNRRATCFPAYADELNNQESAGMRVVVDGNCITSQAAGTAMEFALKLVEILFGSEKAHAVSTEIVGSFE